MVNAETDVLPRVQAILERLQKAVDEVNGNRSRLLGSGDVQRTAEMVRVW
jgi:hypothetical protein